MIDKIRCEKRIGNDVHKELIAMFKEIQNGWEIPMHISEDEYNAVRDNRTLYLSFSFNHYNRVVVPTTMRN